MPPSTTSPVRPNSRLRLLKLSLLLFLAAAPLACAGSGIDPGALGGTAQALAQTAQAASGPVGTALAGVPQTATVLAGTLIAEATALAPTLAAGASQLAPTAAALATDARGAVDTAATAAAQFTPPATSDPALASAAITTYAQQSLGLSVTVLQAGGLTGEIQHLINLPQTGTAAVGATAQVAAVTYGAILNNGAASLSYGNGSLSGDLNVELNAASLGAFSVDAQGSPRNAAEALQLALTTFPALSGQSYTQIPVTQGYAWVAQGQVPGFDSQTKQPKQVTQAEILSVVPAVLGHNLVSAVVGKGDFASSLLP